MARHGRYTILGKLADGGMAEIFLATQHGAEGFEKHVVLKRILTQFSADPQFRNMLLDEGHISMSLQHSNIVQVLDLGAAGSRYFLVMELVDGWDLERIMQRAHAAGVVWPPALALYVVTVVCRALAYAHGKTRAGKPLGIVHRDISPNNVLISEQGEVKLADFGIAKAQRKREQTAAGVIKGKVAYMSPEQATGTAIDKRSDIFSVGSLLYRMLTDRLPFDAPSDLEQLLLRVQRADVTPLEKVKPGLSPAVATIIMRAMRLAPAERYQTADEMLADVERVLRTEFQSAGQDRAQELARAARAPRQHREHWQAAGRHERRRQRRPRDRSVGGDVVRARRGPRGHLGHDGGSDAAPAAVAAARRRRSGVVAARGRRGSRRAAWPFARAGAGPPCRDGLGRGAAPAHGWFLVGRDLCALGRRGLSLLLGMGRARRRIGQVGLGRCRL